MSVFESDQQTIICRSNMVLECLRFATWRMRIFQSPGAKSSCLSSDIIETQLQIRQLLKITILGDCRKRSLFTAL